MGKSKGLEGESVQITKRPAVSQCDRRSSPALRTGELPSIAASLLGDVAPLCALNSRSPIGVAKKRKRTRKFD